MPSIYLNILSADYSEALNRLSQYPAVKGRLAGHYMVEKLLYRLPMPGRVRSKLIRMHGAYLASRDRHTPQVNFPAPGANPNDKSRLYWIPDFQHVHLPEFFEPFELEMRDKVHREISECEGILVLSSESARQDFFSLYPEARIHTRLWSFCSGISVSENGGAPNPVEQYGLPKKYLYLPNQFWAHKDHITVFRALAILKERGLTPSLVCTGFQDDYRNPGFFQSLQDFLSEKDLKDQVRFLGVVPRKNQIEVFRYAAAVVQPSLFEGWSTVIEDAKAIGRPILTSDFPVHFEQLKGLKSTWFFKCSAPEELADLIEEKWHLLNPGPDPAAESEATERTAARRQASAREFMTIVREALALQQ